MSTHLKLIPTKTRKDFNLSKDEWGALVELRFRKQHSLDVLASLEEKGFLQNGEVTELGHEALYCDPSLGVWDYAEDGKIWMSCAMVVSDGVHNHALLHAYGPAIDFHIEQAGFDAKTLELYAPEAGVWVWEGAMGSKRIESYDSTFGYEYEYEVSGTWRRPTAEEWASIQEGACPWDRETLPKWKK